MLEFKTKLKIFNSILNRKEVSYADSFNGLIFMFAENTDFNFLNILNSENDIEKWIENLKSRIIMHEDESILEDIVDDYIDYTLSGDYINNFLLV